MWVLTIFRIFYIFTGFWRLIVLHILSSNTLHVLFQGLHWHIFIFVQFFQCWNQTLGKTETIIQIFPVISNYCISFTKSKAINCRIKIETIGLLFVEYAFYIVSAQFISFLFFETEFYFWKRCLCEFHRNNQDRLESDSVHFIVSQFCFQAFKPTGQTHASWISLFLFYGGPKIDSSFLWIVEPI